MSFQRFESRFCAFEGPTKWRIVPGLGMVDDSNQELKRSAVVMENWIDPPQNASAYLVTQVKTIKEERPETEVIDEQSLDSRHLSEALLVTYRTPIPDDGALQEEVPLLREQDGEPGQVDDPVVHLRDCEEDRRTGLRGLEPPGRAPRNRPCGI